MAVPKKRTSKSKKNIRKANWKKKATKQAEKALSLAFSALANKKDTKATEKTGSLGFSSSATSRKDKNIEK